LTYVSDWDKGLLQPLQNNFPKNHSTQCSIHIQHNVLTKFRLKSASTQVHEISKMFLYYQEEKMLEKICLLSPATHDYFVGDVGIEASKYCSTKWLRNTKLPPRYGIVSTNILVSLNSMYNEARKLPWLYCLDNVLNSMSSCISTLRSVNKNKTGVVPECYKKLENRWTTSASYKSFCN
jgi:transposase-like protein